MDVCLSADVCHVLLMSVNLDNIANLNVTSVAYSCVISRISKSEAINLLQNVDLSEKIETLESIKNLLSYIKWVKKL